MKPENRTENKLRGKMVNIEKILEQVDQYFEENKGEEAEKLMRQSIVQAVQEDDDGSLLQLLNELMGYYRETGQEENALQIATQAIVQAKRMELEGTIPYATTLLNVASVCRVFGRLQDAMGYYDKVQTLYRELLEPDSMLMAGLKNNMALLYQETGDYAAAEKSLLEALNIVEKKGAAYELGVTCANLAGTCIELGKEERAYQYGTRSMEIFREAGITDNHYAAAQAALGTCCYRRGDFIQARDYYRQALETVEKYVGRNGFYYRLQENAEACTRAMEKNKMESSSSEHCSGQKEDAGKDDTTAVGLRLAREYYEKCGRPMIERDFPEYAGRIAAGIAGGGSDCFGYDDEASRDHDWGPDFCLWISDRTWEEIGEKLQQAYERLPKEFMGYRRAPRVNGRGRRGVIKISDFYRGYVGTDTYEQIDWRQVNDASLAAAVNGQVFRDDEGIFSEFREKLKRGFPDEIRFLKLAESGAKFSQTAQYNSIRMRGRGDMLTAHMMVWDGIREAMRLQHYLEEKYPPHDKWLRRSLLESEKGRKVGELLDVLADALNHPGKESAIDQAVAGLGAYFAMEMYQEGVISDTDSYLDAHTQELIFKASLGTGTEEELADRIVKLEFEAFDKVKNKNGRASCQDDWGTFSIMRKSQYLTWNRQMLMQYLYDFHREYQRGHNLIEEKYGRMMESTAPAEYDKIKEHFPVLTREKKDIIERIVAMQVSWMEEFADRYPALAGNARSIHTYEDTEDNTSYETYLRGELGTYSDKMLELYGRYVVEYARAGRNPACDIMKNSVEMYGYTDMEEAERLVGME